MCLATNVMKRRGSARYYARLSVPKDLRAVIGKRELWKSLGTADARLARERAAPVLALWHAEFADLRRKHNPTRDDLQAAVWRHYQAELELDRAKRANMPKAADFEAAKAEFVADAEAGKTDVNDLGRIVDLLVIRDAPATERNFREIREKTVREHLAKGETALISWAVDDVIARERLLVTKDSPAYYELAQMLQRAELEALLRAQERDRGDWGGKLSDEIVAPPAADAGGTQTTAKPGESIMELFDRFQRERGGSIGADTRKQNRRIVTLFTEFVGENAHISAVNRRSIRDWKHHLEKWPVKAADIGEFKGLKFKQVIEKNILLGKRTIEAPTINKHLAALGKFSTWLLANDYIAEPVMTGMYLDENRRERKRLPFTSDQLTELFRSPLYTGFQSDGKEHQPGNLTTRGWRFWLPLVGLYTGARLGEIAQIHTADVRQIHGTWVIHVTTEGGDKSTKTAGSMRVIPVHSELIRLGFLDYHAKIKARHEKRLFPEIEPDARGFLSGRPSEFYRDYLRRIGIKTKQDRTINFHSLRHGFADALRRAGYRDEEFGFLLGHTKASTTGRYGIVAQGVLEQRVAMIEGVGFPGVDLKHLYVTGL